MVREMPQGFGLPQKSVKEKVDFFKQRGSVYLSYALLAFGMMLAGALLVSIHKAFALLLPMGILVFFLPNLLGLWARLQAAQSFHHQLATVHLSRPSLAFILKNEGGGLEAQAIWLDASKRAIGLVSGDGVSRFNDLAKLTGVRGVFSGEEQAVSFHRGTVHIPARYTLEFEFNGESPFHLVTMKRKRMRKWLETLSMHMEGLLALSSLEGKI